MARKSGRASKVDMVRDAIDNLGWSAKPDTYVEYIKNKFKVDMTKAHISQTKSAERKRRGVRGARKRRGTAEEPIAAKNGIASVSDILAFVEAVKSWEGKIGAQGIRDVVKNVLKK
jgi:hypothetical protein